MTVFLGGMRWAETTEPLCVGIDEAQVRKEALRIAIEQNGAGDVHRGSAMCSAPIEDDDIEVEEIQWVGPLPKSSE